MEGDYVRGICITGSPRTQASRPAAPAKLESSAVWPTFGEALPYVGGWWMVGNGWWLRNRLWKGKEK